jgi:hypothetical protein
MATATNEAEGQRAATASAVGRALEDAVWAATPSAEWLATDCANFDLIQGGIARWVKDAVFSLRRSARSMQIAASEFEGQEIPSGDALEALEDALVRTASARDKLRAVVALVLGVPSLRPYKKGIHFKPNEREVRTALSGAGAAGSSQAGRVKRLFEEISEHPSIKLRNDIIHAIAPLSELADLCWVKRAHLDERGGIRAWEGGPLYPEDSLSLPDAQPATLFRWALASAEEGFDLVAEAIAAIAAMTEEIGVLAPPQSVYRWPDGRVQFEDPRLANHLITTDAP